MVDRDHSRSPRGSGSEDIVLLVVQREQARLSKDWKQADAFRDQLGAFGVKCDDKSNTWKGADGRTGRIPTFTEVENGAGDARAVMAGMQEKAQAPPPAYSSDSEEGRIKNMIREREEARSAKDFGRSDMIRDELKAAGVDIFDKDKIWKSNTGSCGVIIGYNAGGSSPSPTDVEISTLVQQREKARSNKEWEVADMIRDELKLWGVDIFDKDKMFRCSDGRSGPVPQWSQVAPGMQQMVVGYGGMQAAVQMHPSHQANLNQLIAACVANAQNPATSAWTMSLLHQAANPPGGQRTPYGGLHHGTPSPPQHQRGLPAPPQRGPPSSARRSTGSEVQDAENFCRKRQGRAVTDQEIMWLLGVREKCRRDKDYSGADNLRETFRSVGLEMHEKEKAWAMTDGRRGEIPPWASLD